MVLRNYISVVLLLLNFQFFQFSAFKFKGEVSLLLNNNTLRQCCQFQNSFRDGECIKSENISDQMKFPLDLGFAESLLFKPNCQNLGFTGFDVPYQGLEFVSKDLISIEGLVHETANICIDSVRNESHVRIITCQRSCLNSQTCTRKCNPKSYSIHDNMNNSKNADFVYSAPYQTSETNLICKNVSHILSSNFKLREDGSAVILYDPNPLSKDGHTSIWLSFFEDSFCVDQVETQPVIVLCNDALDAELEHIQDLFQTFLQKTYTSAAHTTGAISIVSSSFLLVALIIYLILWKNHNVHAWTQFSFLLALFFTYFVAGLRRLIGYEKLIKADLAQTFESLEDFAAVSTSGNLVALSFDLFMLLWLNRPKCDRREGMKRFAITTTLAWLSGLIVMIAGLIIKNEQTYQIKPSELTHINKYLPKLMEFFLCIQNDMLLSICLPLAQLILFTANLLLFGASVFVLHRRHKASEIIRENWATNKIFRFWVRRFGKLSLLMGMWWPMIIICVFECGNMLNYTTRVWMDVLQDYYLRVEKVNFEIPWHMYLISNLLAFQSIVTSILFTFNGRRLKDLKRVFGCNPPYQVKL